MAENEAFLINFARKCARLSLGCHLVAIRFSIRYRYRLRLRNRKRNKKEKDND